MLKLANVDDVCGTSISWSLTLLMRCVRDEQGQARLLLEMSREGYFTNDLLLEQVARTIDVFVGSIPMQQLSSCSIMLLPTAKFLVMH